MEYVLNYYTSYWFETRTFNPNYMWGIS